MLWPARAVLVPALASLVAAVPSLLVARDAIAQDGGATSQSDGVVELQIVGAEDPALRDSIRELLTRLNLALVLPGTPNVSVSSKVASVQIDLSSPTDALVVVTDAATGETRLRRSVPRDPSAAITREEIAHAVQSAVEAALLAARDRAAQPPPPPPAPSPPVVAPPLPPAPVVKEQPVAVALPSRFGLEFATLAGVGPIADGAGPGSRIGLGATAVSRAPLRPSLALSFLFAVPFDTSTEFDSGTENISTQTNLYSARALPGIGLLRGRWLAADLTAGGGFDVVTVAPHSSTLAASHVNGQTTRVDPILSSMLTAHAGVGPGVVLLLSAGVDVDLASRQYVFAQGSTDMPVLEPWRVRPMVLVGFGFTALGDGFFPSRGGH